MQQSKNIPTVIFYQGEENSFDSFIADAQFSQIIMLADANTNGFCIPIIKKLVPRFKNASVLVIPQGEQNKSIDVCKLIWSGLEDLAADTTSLLINVGGGMISDIGGFAASVYKRGISFIHIPTTLLAMVDACYGGKNGIDFHGLKNSIGCFQHPVAIYINPIFLHTLDERILRSGFAESIKHELISKESKFNDMLHYSLEDFSSLQQIRHSLNIKVGLVQQDEFDKGIRQTLNFGHSIGHAIESYSLQSSTPLLHGEAVLLGMIRELRISELIFGLDNSTRLSLSKLLLKFFPSLTMKYRYENIRDYLIHDKKNNDGIRMSLLKQIGDCQVQVSVSEKQIQETFE